MRLTKIKWILAAALTALLTACGGSDLDKKTPDLLYREGMAQIYAGDAQFNYKVEVSVDLQQMNPFLTDSKFILSGAANNSLQRYEILPEVKTAMFSFNLPHVLDLKKQELLANPSNALAAMQMLVPDMSPLQRYQNKFVRLTPESFRVKEEQLAEGLDMFYEMLGMMSDVFKDVSHSIPDSGIRKLNMDDYGKQINAKVLINVKLDKEQIRMLEQRANTLLKEKITQSEKLPDDFKANFLQGLELNEAAQRNTLSLNATEALVYLNGKGQIIHNKSTHEYSFEGQQLVLKMAADFSNYGKAKFTLNPRKDEIIDLTANDIQQLQDGLK